MIKSIKSVSLYRYDILENGLADEIENWGDFIQTKTEYAADNRITKEITFGHWGEPDEVIEYEYDENDLLKEERYFHGGEEVSESVIYIRDANRNIISELHRFLDGSEDVTDYQYDEQSRLISKIQTDSEGSVERQEFYQYSGELLVSESIEEINSNLVTKNSYSYNNEGILEQSEQFISDDGKSERTVNQFDESGKRIKALKYNTQDKLIEITRYNYQDNLLQEIEDENQKGKSYIKFYYDEQGNITTQEEMNENGEVISTIERTFDEDGRLLEATIYIDGLNYRPNQHYMIRYAYEFFE